MARFSICKDCFFPQNSKIFDHIKRLLVGWLLYHLCLFHYNCSNKISYFFCLISKVFAPLFKDSLAKWLRTLLCISQNLAEIYGQCCPQEEKREIAQAKVQIHKIYLQYNRRVGRGLGVNSFSQRFYLASRFETNPIRPLDLMSFPMWTISLDWILNWPSPHWSDDLMFISSSREKKIILFLFYSTG